MATTVIGVPGCWTDRVELQARCMEHGFLWAGVKSAVIDRQSNAAMPFTVEVYDPAPEMRRAFELASAGRLPNKLLDEIASHTMTIYIVSEGNRSIDDVVAAMRFASVLLDCGGLAVKIESAGVAHSVETWKGYLSMAIPRLTAYHALTVRVIGTTSGESYSCGMQSLNLPDADVRGNTQEHPALLDLFAKYMLFEHPDLRDGNTFSVADGAPKYRLRHGTCDRFPEDDLFHNPFGVWHLTPDVGTVAIQGPDRSGGKRMS